MHRVLRLGGKAIIVDMRSDATDKSIANEVAKMNLGRINALFTRGVLRLLRKRAYSKQAFERMLARDTVR
jgi:hypothetical protein